MWVNLIGPLTVWDNNCQQQQKHTQAIQPITVLMVYAHWHGNPLEDKHGKKNTKQAVGCYFLKGFDKEKVTNNFSGMNMMNCGRSIVILLLYI